MIITISFPTITRYTSSHSWWWWRMKNRVSEGKWWTKKDWARLLLAFRTHHLPVTLTSVSPSVPPSVPLRERVTDERREKGTRRESKEKVKKVMRDHVIPILTAFRILFTSVASGWDYIVPERSLYWLIFLRIVKWTQIKWNKISINNNNKINVNIRNFHINKVLHLFYYLYLWIIWISILHELS